MPKPRFASAAAAGMRLGFRSGLESKVSDQLRGQGVEFSYEDLKVKYVKPARAATYTPDFFLPHNGIIVETKGRFEADDREKHLLIQAQHPNLDIRFVFSNSNTRIRAGSPTTYAIWCRTHGFQFADKTIPAAWLTEPKDPARYHGIGAAAAGSSLTEWATFKLARKRT